MFIRPKICHKVINNSKAMWGGGNNGWGNQGGWGNNNGWGGNQGGTYS